MPRPPRLHVPGAMHHVTARGNHRQDIFFQHKDRQLLDDIMADALDRTGARIHAYCWMTNHVHLLTQVGDQPLGRLMQRVGTRFSRAIQRNLSTTGHLFENRYHAVLVDVDSYFLELLRYIHLNPVRARIVETPQQYRWSSHRVYLAKTTQPWVHIDFGLSLFSKDPDRARVLHPPRIRHSTLLVLPSCRTVFVPSYPPSTPAENLASSSRNGWVSPTNAVVLCVGCPLERAALPCRSQT